MKIILQPEDLIKRCLWDSYVYYILGSEKEAQRLLEENNEFEISERDALVIGLLKTIETDNLIYKFNSYLLEILTNKSIKEKELIIRKKILDSSIDKFLTKFPDYWTPNLSWNNSLNELKNYIINIKIELSKIEVMNVEIMNINSEFYSTNTIKKILKFQY
jgi:hypothetical protein